MNHQVKNKRRITKSRLHLCTSSCTRLKWWVRRVEEVEKFFFYELPILRWIFMFFRILISLGTFMLVQQITYQ